MEFLDLESHGLDEIAGKGFVLNGREYEFLPSLAEGGSKIVFPLRNQLSRTCRLVAKVLRFGPSSPEYKELWKKREWISLFSSSDSLLMATESYEFGGGMVQIEESKFGLLNESDAFVGQVARFCKSGEHARAVELLDSVLADNPYNDLALVRRAALHELRGNRLEALGLLLQAVFVEPNYKPLYILASDLFLSIGSPEEAIDILRRGWQLYPCNWHLWSALIKRALNLDFVEPHGFAQPSRALAPMRSRRLWKSPLQLYALRRSRLHQPTFLLERQ